MALVVEVESQEEMIRMGPGTKVPKPMDLVTRAVATTVAVTREEKVRQRPACSAMKPRLTLIRQHHG